MRRLAESTGPPPSARIPYWLKLPPCPNTTFAEKPVAIRLRERLTVFEHSIVAGIGNVEIARAVHRDSSRQAQTVRVQAPRRRPGRAAVASRGPENRAVRSRCSRSGRCEAGGVVPSEDAVVAAVDYIQMRGRAAEVDRHLAREIETRRIAVVDRRCRAKSICPSTASAMLSPVAASSAVTMNTAMKQASAIVPSRSMRTYWRRTLCTGAVFHEPPHNRSDPSRPRDMEPVSCRPDREVSRLTTCA